MEVCGGGSGGSGSSFGGRHNIQWIKPLILWEVLFGLRGGWGCVVCVARVVKTIEQNICARLQIIVTLQLSYKMSYRHVGLAFKIRSVNR